MARFSNVALHARRSNRTRMNQLEELIPSAYGEEMDELIDEERHLWDENRRITLYLNAQTRRYEQQQ